MPIDTLQNFYAHFQANQRERNHQAMRGIAIDLALLLVDERDGMRQFICADRIDHSLEKKLRDAFPYLDLLASFANVNERFFELLERFEVDV